MKLPEQPEATPRNVAKYVVKTIVHGGVANISKNVIAEHTRLNRSGQTVKITGFVIGWYVSEKLSPITDKLVDKAADFIVAKRAEWKAKREAKKNKTSEEEK